MTLQGSKKKKSLIPKIFTIKEKCRRQEDEEYSCNSSGEIDGEPVCSAIPPFFRKSISATDSNFSAKTMNFKGLRPPSAKILQSHSLRIFVATWNVGGKTPHNGLNLDNILQVDNQSDIYVLGFQEIVPLNAGNVLVIEDNEPAAKWLSLINQSLNKTECSITLGSSSDLCKSVGSQASRDSKSPTGLLFFQKPSLKTVSKSFRTEKGRKLKSCNCPLEVEKKYTKETCFGCQEATVKEEDSSSEEEDGTNGFMVTEIPSASFNNHLKYSLIAIKQMVGIFVTIWVRKELVQHISHLRLSCMARGIMGCLGNKGCIAVSMYLHQTSFCFVCSHLASGEKEGDELRRNLDVIEILKNTQFPRICKTPNRRIPEKILEHDRVIWLGDLNYRIALSYSETRILLEDNDWHALLEKDQLKIERDAGRVFKGWHEGKIYFAPTYKYSYNSDAYAGETITSKKKRRTPAWCDRILWHGDGITQLSYIRGESRFSDHRPVCAVFLVDVEVLDSRSKKGLPSSNMRVEVEELLPSSSSYMPLKYLY